MISRTLAPEQRPLHVLNRLAFGPRPGDLENLNRIGFARWIDQQLYPEALPLPPQLTQQLDSLATLRMDPIELFEEYAPQRQARAERDSGSRAKPDPVAIKAARQRARVIVEQAMQARLYRAVSSPAQLQEVMTAFWCNHFNVFAQKGACFLWIGAYEQEAIRPHALGRFRDLLGATAQHPAMLFYLDNWQNSAPGSAGPRGKESGINENYARELMELHTLGVNGGYSQRDVIALAHILTGWTIARRDASLRRRLAPGAVRTSGGFFFAPARHDYSAQVLLGYPIPSGGIEMGERALDLLAAHPATARHLSYQLAQYFVADSPPAELVERMARRYLSTGGNIRDVLATLFASPEFWDTRWYASKFKTPYEYVVSAVRATGSPVRNIRPLVNTMTGLGMPLYGCQTPDGYKNIQDAWLSPNAMMTRLSFTTALGNGRLPLARPMTDFEAAEPPMPPAAADGNLPPDPIALGSTLENLFSSRTNAALETAPERLRVPLMLGSPEFMMR